MMRQQQMNGGMSAAEGAPDLMQRLARLPTPPDVGPLRRRYLSPFPLCHKHHLMKTTRFRWCCIDLLNSPFFGVRYKDAMTGACDFDRMALGPLGIPTLQVRVDGSIASRHYHPARFGSPGGRGDRR